MLVLSRKKGEAVIIDGEIEITVVAIEGDTIKLSINAPKHIPIHRKEIYLAIQEENKISSKLNINFDEIKKV